MTQYVLYGRRNSGSLVIQAALEDIGVPYDVRWVAADAADYGRTCPTGRVPALQLPDGTLMFESAAILIHLSLTHPDSDLAPPPGTPRHARFLQWMVFLSANLYESVLRIYYAKRYTTGGEAAAEGVRLQATQAFLAHLALIGGSLGPYVLGAEYSIADVYLSMLAAWYPDGKEALYGRMPVLERHAEALSRRASFIKANADHAE